MRPTTPKVPVTAPAHAETPTLGQMRLWLSSLRDELQTPLHTIHGMTELCLQSSLEPVNRDEMEAINLANRQLEWQVSNLLLLAEIDTKKLTLDSQSVSLLGLGQEIQAQWPLWTNGSQQLQFEWPQSSKIIVDSQKLKRVLGCLIAFVSKQGGDVACRAKSMADISTVSFQCEVMPASWQGQYNPSQLLKIFEMSPGLALAKQLVTMMAGKLELVSYEGEFGFLLTLDCERPRMSGGTGFIPQEDQDLPVLLVDDHGLNRQLVMALFERLQLPLPAIAEHGMEALEFLDQSRAKLVLMDIQMPVMDGVTAIKRLRAQPRWKNLVVVALSANHTEADVKEYLNVGFNAVLPKPFEFGKLKDTLQQFGIECEEAVAPEDIPEGIWPAHAALDCNKALSRLNLDDDLYGDLLVRFANGQPQLLTQIPEAYAASDWQTLTRLLHTLKGVAASLGSDRLSHLAAEAGQAISLGKDWSSDALLSLLMDIINAINSWRELQTLNELGETISDAQLEQLLHKLRELLQQSDAAAVSLVAQLQNCTHARLTDFEIVFELTGNFAFDQAEVALQKLLADA
ncbi:response regulator [Shewanella sp. NIFS-20-20]|uniref:response regulator n=1 Tax=Shewanella sp. NIFS-20-20 TaxID=2853806 RepID=UPI001C477070|nr:response regulator [Shewanella sp. NIFS-20-20]MBV7314103.1 response regulator [Shewanella sp. NIFS-20-20]